MSKEGFPLFADIEKVAPHLRKLSGDVLEVGLIRICTTLIWKNKEFGTNKPERWEWHIALFPGRGLESRIWIFPFERWKSANRFRGALYFASQLGVYEAMIDPDFINPKGERKE